jgi:hypothetical protein
MPVTFIKNVKGKFTNEKTSAGIEKFKGWWNTVTGGHFDHDVYIDYIPGNTRLNNCYPYVGDSSTDQCGDKKQTPGIFCPNFYLPRFPIHLLFII